MSLLLLVFAVIGHPSSVILHLRKSINTPTSTLELDFTVKSLAYFISKMSEPSSEKGKSIVYTVLGFWLGAFVFIRTQDAMADRSEEWLRDCNNFTHLKMGEWLEAHPDYVKYEESWGFHFFKVLVCMNTQLANELQENNASALICITLATIALPLIMTILLEAGRKDAVGLVKIPLACWLLIQNFGIAVAFPLVWLPSYCFMRGSGSVNPIRVYASYPMALPVLIITILVFYFTPENPLWADCAAIWGGPGIALMPAFLSSIPHPALGDDEETKKAAKRSRNLIAMMYGIAGLTSLAVWMWLLFIMVIPTFGLSSLSGVYMEVWVNAPPALRCKTIEVLVLWLAGILYISFQNKQAAIEAIGLSVIFGPGAGLSLALAGVTVADDSESEDDKEKIA
jgi:hypothetical protein